MNKTYSYHLLLLYYLFYELPRCPSELTIEEDEENEECDDSSTLDTTLPIHDPLFHLYMDNRIKYDWIPMIEKMDIAEGKKAVYYEDGSVIKLE